ncbi:MAG: DUF3592 domain-containing protein [Clostridia bacterium]|nr:DUF3592 domain-containing protein [Clostridia bacterium]
MRKIFNIVFPIVFVVAGIFVVILGIGKLRNKDTFDASTTAVISGIEREWKGTDSDGFDEYDYTVYINYEVDGKKYENVEYPGYNSSMKTGDELEIKYESANPENISEANITGSATIMIVMGAVFALVGIVSSLRALIRR